VVLVEGQAVPQLSVPEFRLLHALAQQAGHVLTFADAAAAAWPRRSGMLRPRPKRVHALASRVRTKLGRGGALLRVVRGVGYVLDLELVQRSRYGEHR
jgi:DNA-binding response OmpR family regulator